MKYAFITASVPSAHTNTNHSRTNELRKRIIASGEGFSGAVKHSELGKQIGFIVSAKTIKKLNSFGGEITHFKELKELSKASEVYLEWEGGIYGF